MLERSAIVWHNGKCTELADADVPFLTHSLHYGSGVFEGIRFYTTDRGPAIFRLPEHLERLERSAQTLLLDLPYARDELTQAHCDVVVKNNQTEGYIRPLVYFGDKMGLNPEGADTHTTIASWPWGKYHGDELRVKISPYRRIAENSTHVEAKIAGHYVNSILAIQDAKKDGFDEALLLDQRGAIAEGSVVNIFFVSGNVIVTPQRGAILSGITRDTVITLARDAGYAVEERDIGPDEIASFDEAFFTGTAAEVTPIRSIDEHTFASSRVGTELAQTYHDVVTGKNETYNHWLTYVS